MDIILTPSKLKGTLHSRPSAVSVCLHKIAQAMAAHAGDEADPAYDGNSSGIRGGVEVDMNRLSRAEIEPADMDAMSRCLEAIFSGADRADTGKSLKNLYLSLPIAAAMREGIAFVGDEGLTEETIRPATEILEKHGLSFSKGALKIKRRDRKKYQEIISTSGKLQYGHVSLNGKEDPWFLAGLLFAMPLLEGNSTIRTTTLPESSELANMTVKVLEQYGIHIDASVDEYGYPHYSIPGSQKYSAPEDPRIEGDWTAAAFWLGCGALGGNVTVRGLDPDSIQNSRQILDKLHTMGAAAGMGEDGANVTAASLTGCNINAGHIPHLITILSVCLASASGSSTLTDIGGFDPQPLLKVLNALGGEASLEGSSICFKGKPFLDGGDAGRESDPVTILAAAAVSCISSEAVLIRNAGAINKYYPDFFDEFESLGGKIRVLP